jgi:radical SAM superfamily enzyme YgiQ (UPF0313 family)
MSRILLVNTNRYHEPPAPPLALEYLAGDLDLTAHEYEILDLCFEPSPNEILSAMLDEGDFDVVGFTIRNIDTVIYHNNIFFLDDIVELAETVKQRGIPLILGGAGFSFAPAQILSYIGADYGVSGPGEKALPVLLDMIERSGVGKGTSLDGRRFLPANAVSHRNIDSLDYERYTAARGLIGYETQKGCNETCTFCREGNGLCVQKSPQSVVEELNRLYAKGIGKFHLCDTEFNQDIRHCKHFLELFIEQGPPAEWSLYMKAYPVDEKLFELLKKSGATMVTLSLPSGRDSMQNAAAFGAAAKEAGLKLAVDFLCGFPGETRDDLKRSIDILRGMGADTVGVNNYIRLYPGLEVTKRVLSSPEKYGKKHVIGEYSDEDSLIHPVFYNHITAEELKDIIGGDPIFTIEGFERSSNYERLHGSE